METAKQIIICCCCYWYDGAGAILSLSALVHTLLYVCFICEKKSAILWFLKNKHTVLAVMWFLQRFTVVGYVLIIIYRGGVGFQVRAEGIPNFCPRMTELAVLFPSQRKNLK